MIKSIDRTIDSKWHVIYIRPGFERKVAAKLAEKDIEFFLPTRIEIRQWHDRKKKLEVPVFPGYVFVKVDQKDLVQIYHVAGFIRFLMTGDVMDVLSDQEVDAMKRLFKSDYQIADFENYEGVPVRVIDGPLIGLEGYLEGVEENGRVVVCIEILNKNIKALVVPGHLERKEEDLAIAG